MSPPRPASRPHATSPDRPCRGVRVYAFALVILTTVAACDQRQIGTVSRPNRRLTGKIVLLPDRSGDPGWTYVASGARKFLSDLNGIEFRTIAPPADDKPFDEAVRAALADHPDVAIFPVSDPQLAKPLVEFARSSAASVITYGQNVDVNGVYTQITVDRTSGVGQLATQLPRLIAPRHSYVLIHENGASPLASASYRRFVSEIQRQFAIKRLDEINLLAAKLDMPAAIRLALKRFPNTGAIVALAPRYFWTADATEIEQLPCRFATVSCAPPMWHWLRTGRAAGLVGVIDGRIGNIAAQLAIRAISGTEGSANVEIVSSELVTRTTLPDYARRYAEAIEPNLAAKLPSSAPGKLQSQP